MLGIGQGPLGHGHAAPNHTTHQTVTLIPSPGYWPWGHQVDPLTRPGGNGTHLSWYLEPRPARSRLSPNDESEAAASVVDERGRLTCLRHAHGGPAAAQCSRSGARGPDGSRAARRRSSALRASSPYPGLGPPAGVNDEVGISGQGTTRRRRVGARQPTVEARGDPVPHQCASSSAWQLIA